ncbi:unknown [Brachyspira sp. CAG:484]|mgnify:CR=1 FL=1|nr:unknown [Brachyspira sp. CAG:484]
MKRSLILLGLCAILTSQTAFAEYPEGCNGSDTRQYEVGTTQNYNYSYQLLIRIKKQREILYNALNLTQEQVKCKNEIEKKRYAELEPALEKLCIEDKKLKDLKKRCASKKTIRQQEKALNCARKNIQTISEKYDKELYKILTHDQRTKYSMIRKLKKDDLKKYRKIQEKGRKPSDLRPFGEKILQPEYKQEQHAKNCFWHKMINKMKKNK